MAFFVPQNFTYCPRKIFKADPGACLKMNVHLRAFRSLHNRNT